VGGFDKTVVVIPRSVLDDPSLYGDMNVVLGAMYTPKATTFRVFAPTARAVQVVIYDQATGDKGRSLHSMQATGKGIWEAKVAGDLDGRFYLYKPDGEGFRPDRKRSTFTASAPSTASQRARGSRICRRRMPLEWEKAKMGRRSIHGGYGGVRNARARFYHRRKFWRGAQRYLGFAESGTHLPSDRRSRRGWIILRSGSNHVQLMPVQDLITTRRARTTNWGYMTSAYCSPEGWYATNINNDSRIRELKQLIAALHVRDR
jgi:pullulanase